MQSVIIFASGGGSNANAIINYFKKNQTVLVSLIVCNNEDAGVLEIAKKNNVPFWVISKKTLEDKTIIDQLKEYKPSIIVLAGFLWKVPPTIIKAFRGRIINIHPSLLPKYGGKGMYGQNVHKAVIENKEQESGITIHYVNEAYDEGAVIMQAHCPVIPGEPAKELAQRVLKLEHFYLPRTIDLLLQSMN